jgi:hypothetical protein
MKVDRHALAIARLEVETGTPEDKARVKAWDRLDRLLSTLDSKTSVLLRFNSIVVAALAYLVIVSATEPFAQSNAIVKTVGVVIGHLSLLASVLSCGFAFPVINVEWNFFGGRLDHRDGSEPVFDDAALERIGELVTLRTRLYSRAWQLAVAGGAGFAIMVALATIHIP